MSSGKQTSKGPMPLNVNNERGRDRLPPTAAVDPGTPEPAMQPTVPRADQDGVPVCPVHNCVMHASSTQSETTYYKCQVDGCDETAKKRKKGTAFAKPMLCPLAACTNSNHGKPFPMVIGKKQSKPGRLIMECSNPHCAYEANVVDPRMVGMSRVNRPADDLSAR